MHADNTCIYSTYIVRIKYADKIGTYIPIKYTLKKKKKLEHILIINLI